MRLYSSSGLVVGTAVTLGLLLAASPASAECDPDTAIFEDDFEYLDGSWAQPSDNILVEDGVLVLKGWGQINNQTWSTAADVCADMTIADAPEPEANPAQLIFWWENWDNYYRLMIWSDSFVELRRMVKGKDLTIFSSEKTPAVKQGVGEVNHVELKLRPKDITVFINGTEITRLKAKPPKDGGAIGFGGWSSEEKPMTAKFDNLVVSKPAQ